MADSMYGDKETWGRYRAWWIRTMKIHSTSGFCVDHKIISFCSRTALILDFSEHKLEGWLWASNFKLSEFQFCLLQGGDWNNNNDDFLVFL